MNDLHDCEKCVLPDEIARLRRKNRRLMAWMRRWEDGSRGEGVLACVTMNELRAARRGEKPTRWKP